MNQTQQIRLTPDQAIAHVMLDQAVNQLQLAAQMLTLQCPAQKDAAKVLVDSAAELTKRAQAVRDGWQRSIQVVQSMPSLVQP